MELQVPAKRLITHWGTFHADDVMSCVVLKKLFPEAKVLRTRDREILSNTTQADIVFDVGYEYDAGRRLYDHHQPGKHLRGDGTPYSSFGLVWLHHGVEYLRTLYPHDCDQVIQSVWDEIDRGLVIEIDRADNGYVPVGAQPSSPAGSVSMMVEDFVPTWDDPDQDHDARFLEAVGTFGGLFERKVQKEVSYARSEVFVLEAFRNSADPKIVVVPDYMPVGSVVEKYGFDEALYLVEHSRNGDWFVNCVPPEGDPFGQRKSLPIEWAGLRDGEMAAVTGVHDAVFCHVNRFTCSARSRESALTLARLAVDWSCDPTNTAALCP